MTSFSSDDELYVSWFCGNKGATTSSDFASKLFVDGKCVWSWGAASGLQNGQGVFWKGLAIGKLSVGSHVMTIVYDYDGQIAESDENNNSYSVTITVSDPLPDLCFFSPEGWATWPHPVFLSNEQNANSAKTSFAEGETIYLNCRFGNKGTTAIARDYRIIHEVLNSSGSVRSSSFYDCTSVEWCAPGEARQWGDSVWPILQGLPVGNYTYRCRLDSNHVIDESDESNNDITIDFKVMSSVQKYTVAFNANGGMFGNAAYSSVVVEQGKSTMQAGASGTKASRTGYALVGWFDTTNSAGGNIVFDARGYAVNGKYWEGAYSPKVSSAKWKHSGNVVAYARWVKTPPCRVVTFDANGGVIGNAAYAAVAVEIGKNTNQAGASGTKSVRTGYTLVGWFDTTNSAGGNILFDARGYAVNGKYWEGAYSPKASSAKWRHAGSVTAYARWVKSPPFRVVTLDANGGAISNAAYAAVVVEDGKATMQAGAFGTKAARAGYSLVGWFDTTNSAGGNIVFDAHGYAVNGKYWDGAYDPGKTAAKWKFSGNVTAYARWIAQGQLGKYTATLNANGGSIGGQPFLSAQTEYGKYTNQAAANRAVTREGYSLVGWFDADGNMVFDARGYAVNGKYWDGAYSPKVSSAKWKYAGNVVAYARWVKTPPYRVVTFDANGGTISNAAYAAAVVEDGKYTMQAGASGTKVARAFYTLVGWFDTTNATGGNVVFDARGYAVTGKYWNGSYEPGKTSATWKYAGNVVAYARWTPAKYTVTLNANGGSVSSQPTVAVQVEYGRYTSQAGANRTVSRSGYRLVGWYDTTAASGGNIVFDARGYAVSGKYWNGSYEPGKTSATWKHVGNVTAYARWAQVSNKYTVTLNANGGTVDGQPGVSFQVEVGKSTSQAGAKRSVERSGYMLRGWYDMDGNIVFDAMGYAVDGKYWDGDYWPNSSSATWKYAGSVTAYARWVPIASNIRVAASGDMEDGFGLGEFVGDALRFFQGEFVGVFSDGGGRFMLTLDEGLETAYFVTWTEDGGVACECEAAVAGDVLILTTETGAVYHLVWDEDGLVATHIDE